MGFNWPNSSIPAWPPPGYSRLEFSDLDALEAWVRNALGAGIANIANPTNPERVALFNETRCNEFHTVTGRMLVIGGVRYPFARCDEPAHREFLVPYSPYYAGLRPDA